MSLLGKFRSLQLTRLRSTKLRRPRPIDESQGLNRGLTVLVVRHVEGRVGTTLLMQLLGTSDEVVMDRVYPFENRYLHYFVHFTKQLGTLYQHERHWNMQTLLDDFHAEVSRQGGPLPFVPLSVDRHDMQHRALMSLWQAFSAAAAAHSRGPVRYYAEKMALGLDPLIDAGIQLRPIDLVRDPRDVLASIQAFNRQRGFPAFGRRADQSDEDYLLTRIAQWKRGLKTMNRPVRGIDPILVRYEDMVGDLPGLAAHLGSVLGVSLDAARVQADRNRYRHHMTSDGGTASVGRWRQDLRSSEIAAIERELRRDMVRLGYSV